MTPKRWAKRWPLDHATLRPARHRSAALSPSSPFSAAGTPGSPRLTEHDLSNLGAYQAAARLVVGAQDQPAFTMKTRPAPEPEEAG